MEGEQHFPHQRLTHAFPRRKREVRIFLNVCGVHLRWSRLQVDSFCERYILGNTNEDEAFWKTLLVRFGQNGYNGVAEYVQSINGEVKTPSVGRGWFTALLEHFTTAPRV